jgi:hypothetical protein
MPFAGPFVPPNAFELRRASAASTTAHHELRNNAFLLPIIVILDSLIRAIGQQSRPPGPWIQSSRSRLKRILQPSSLELWDT